MPRVVCLLGSPRADGCSDRIANCFCDAAETAGAKTVRHALRDLRFQGFTPDTDSLYPDAEDDLDPVLEDISKADILVLATPVYFCDMTSLMKQAFDRFHAFVVEDGESGHMTSALGVNKTLVFIQVQSEPAPLHDDLLDHYRPAFEMLGFSRISHLRACTVREPIDLNASSDSLVAAEKLALDLLRPEFV